MSNISVCARFRPLSSKEIRDHGDGVCIHVIDSETFAFKDEKEEEFIFSFDRVFYERSKQEDVYEFLALPIVQDSVNAINGTIITYGQTGAGKTYSMEGPGVLEQEEEKKGLLPRVVDGLFNGIRASDGSTKYTIKLSMVEIYMERVRDLYDLSKDNIQIKESRTKGILLSGVTEVSITDPMEALQSLSQELAVDRRLKTGKLVLVDLAGSEKAEKTGAEGKVLEEAKMINKSLSALGNVINALTSGSPSKANHIPYRDSKLTRILQDALGGKSRTALLCCCAPGMSNVSESLSTLRFGARAKHIKASPWVNRNEDKNAKRQESISLEKDDSCERILNELREKLDIEDVKLLEELFTREGILSVPAVEDLDSALEDCTLRTISALQQELEELVSTVEELRSENSALKDRIASSERIDTLYKQMWENRTFVHKISDFLRLPFSGFGCFASISWFWAELPRTVYQASKGRRFISCT